jgi:hypothetical protein
MSEEFQASETPLELPLVKVGVLCANEITDGKQHHNPEPMFHLHLKTPFRIEQFTNVWLIQSENSLTRFG